MILETSHVTIDILKELYKQNQDVLRILRTEDPWYKDFVPLLYLFIGAGLTFVTQHYFQRRNDRNKMKEDISKLYAGLGITSTDFSQHLIYASFAYFKNDISDKRITLYRTFINDITSNKDDVERIKGKLGNELFMKDEIARNDMEKHAQFMVQRNKILNFMYEISFRITDSALEKTFEKFRAQMPGMQFDFKDYDASKVEDEKYNENYAQKKTLLAGIDSAHLIEEFMKRVKELA